MKTILAVCVLALLAAGSMKGQEQTSDTMVYRYPGEVVISASRMSVPLRETPYPVSIVDSTDLQSMPRGTSADEALKFVPGVKVDNQANGERVHMSIRGQGILTETGIRSIKILLDGIPINDPTGFAPDLFDVDWRTVGRMEVVRGPAASLYGGGAAGGILNITTQNSPAVPIFGDASAQYGSNNFWKGFGEFGGNADNVNYRLSFSRTAGDGYRVHTHFFENNVYGKATWTPTASVELTPIFSWNDTRHENPEGLSLAQFTADPTLPNDDAVPYDEHMEMNRTTNGLTGRILVADDQELRFNGYVKHSVYVEANNHVFDHQNLTTPGTSVQYSITTGREADQLRNKFSAGADFQWQTINEHSDSNAHSIELDSLWSKQQNFSRGFGIFAADMIEVGANWNIMGSLRLDKIHNELNDYLKTDSSDASGSADFSNVTGRIGVTFTPSTDLSLFASWGQGFIPPSTEEVGTNPNGYRGFNSDLVPSTSNSYELGARGILHRDIEYDVSGYYVTTSNDFDRYRIPGRGNGEEGTFYKNVGATRRFGAECALLYHPLRTLTLQAAYTYSHFTYDIGDPIPILMDDTSDHRAILNGNWLPNSPQHQLMIDLRYDVVPDLMLGLGTETLSKSYIDGANKESEAAAGYTLLNARVVWHWAMAGLSGDVHCQGRNLTDQKYAAFTEPDSGGNSYQPGPGREFFAGILIHL